MVGVAEEDNLWDFREEKEKIFTCRVCLNILQSHKRGEENYHRLDSELQYSGIVVLLTGGVR